MWGMRGVTSSLYLPRGLLGEAILRGITVRRFETELEMERGASLKVLNCHLTGRSIIETQYLFY